MSVSDDMFETLEIGGRYSVIAHGERRTVVLPEG